MDKRDAGPRVVAQRAKDRISKAVRDPIRLCGMLGRLVVIRVAARDERLCASRAFWLGTFERVLDPAADEVSRRRSSPHPGTCHRLEGELGVEIGDRRVAVGERDRPLHRRGETRAVEMESICARDLSPDLELSLPIRLELHRALEKLDGVAHFVAAGRETCRATKPTHRFRSQTR